MIRDVAQSPASCLARWSEDERGRELIASEVDTALVTDHTRCTFYLCGTDVVWVVELQTVSSIVTDSIGVKVDRISATFG